MEVKVSNISKLAPKDTLRTLFAILGTIINFEHYPNIITRDGSYECDIVYANLCEARRALRLSGTALGDRSFTVSLITDATRFRAHQPSERVRKAIGSNCRTGLLMGINGDRLSEEEIASICGGSQAITDVVKLDSGREALVEFAESSGITLAVERIKIAAPSESSRSIRIEEAWRRVDPDYLPIKRAVTSMAAVGGEASRSRPNEKTCRADGRSRSRSRGRPRSHSRSRSRSRSKDGRRGRQYHRRGRSRSRSRSRSGDRGRYHQTIRDGDRGTYHRYRR